MAEPFFGEIRLMSCDFAPKGWALCNGQALPISQNQALFALLGTAYGGDGQVSFKLPDLRGRVPISVGRGRVRGESGGEAAHALSPAELPVHSHVVQASGGSGSATKPGPQSLADGGSQIFGAPDQLVELAPTSLSTAGAGQPHNNMQPYVALAFCIALVGIFPSQN